MTDDKWLYRFHELSMVPADATLLEEGELKLEFRLPMEAQEKEVWARGTAGLETLLEQRLRALCQERAADFALLTKEQEVEQEKYGEHVHLFVGTYQFALYKKGT